MGISNTTEADWEEYYRNVNAFNIPNADTKRVEIWDKAFLSTKTVRETIWEVYSKGFMDGVNDTAERYKDSVYKQKHDSDLLDKVAHRLPNEFCKCCNQETCEGGMVGTIQECETIGMIKDVMDGVIEELKAEVNQ